MLKLTIFVLGLTCALTGATVDLADFMPYGIDAGDADLAKTGHIGNLDDGSSPQIELTETFKFYGAAHKDLWVNINGAVSFNKPIDKYTPTCASLNNDMAMISPFWADVDIRSRGTVYYRQTTDKHVLDKANQEIVKAFPAVGTPAMKWALVATWLDVPFYDDDFCHSWSNLTNTFQLTLSTDGTKSYAIFYYNRIEWTTGTASGSAGCTGHGGKPARAGFDNGKGIMSVLEESCKDNIEGVSQRSIGMTPGKYVFGVDGDHIDAPDQHTLGTIGTVTPPSHPTTESHEDFQTHLITTKKKLGELVDIATKLCPGLIDHPALQDECFEDWKKLDNLIDELQFTKTDDELSRIDYEAQKIARDLHQIMEDIAK